MNRPKTSSRPLQAVLLALLAFIGGAAAVFFVQRRRQKNLQQTVERLQRERDNLRQQNTSLQKQIATPAEHPQPAPPAKTEGRSRSWKNTLILVIVFLLASVGPVLVSLERWFNLPDFRDSLRHLWCRSEFLCMTVLPSYFVVIIPGFLIALLLLLWLNKQYAIPVFPINQPLQERKPANLPGWQHRTSRLLKVIAVVAAAGVFLLAVLQKRQPSGEFPLIVLTYLASTLLKAVDFHSVISIPKRLPKWVAPFLFCHISLILFMRSLNGHPEALLASGLLLALSLVLVLPHRRQIPVILWIIHIAIVLYTVLLQSWRYGIIGDEYIFYHYARIILNEHSLKHILEHLLNARTVIYGKFLYLSTLPHAFSMLLLGDDNFGWRFANIYLAILAIPFFYSFIKDFMSRRAALIYAALFATSHYLTSFSRIGYNNVQALLGMAVILWLAGKAVTTNKDLYYTLLGMSMGLCMYIYPAVLAVLPLPLLLLLFYNPPYRSRRAFQQWILITAGFSLFFLPLIFEPDYWQQKLSESAMDKPAISQRFHFFSNLLYSLFSFLYAPEESHYVVSSYLDPLSGILATLGLSWTIWRARREKFMRFLLAAMLFLFFSLGASRERSLPSVTHMFLILPWWFLFTTLGTEWLLRLFKKKRSAIFLRRAALVSVILLAGMNMVHTYVISPARSDRYHSMEALYLRFLQHQSEPDQLTNTGKFLFITDENWNIYGFNSFRDAYHIPPAQAQLLRVAIQDEPFYPIEERVILPKPLSIDPDEEQPVLELESWAVELAKQPDTVVILKPWLTEYETLSVMRLLDELGKQPCPIQPTPSKDPSFTLWLDETRMDACPRNGYWPRFW